MNIKTIITAVALSASAMICGAEPDGRTTFMLTGASFAVPENGWFEIACADMDSEAINLAVSGEAIYHTARRMDAGTFYTLDQLDRTDVFVLGHVHNQNVANEQWLKDSWEDYSNIATTTDYAVTYDYVIKRYKADCAALEFNPESRWYGVPGGKPVKIMFCTHWHDSRTTYNPAVRKLAEKWGYPLVEFDTNIGFSKDDVAAGEAQPSLAMAHDTETINGVKYGWHPLRGSNSAIQRRMAAIFTAVAAPYVGISVPFEVRLRAVSPMVMPGDDAQAAASFRAGTFPYNIRYCYGENSASAEGIDGIHHIITHPAATADVVFALADATDATGNTAPESSDVVTIADKKISASYDAYIHEAYKENYYITNETLDLKNGDNWSRKIYITFPITEVSDTDHRIALRMFFESYVLGKLNNENRPLDGVETLILEGNTSTYGNTLKWSTHYSHVFEPVAETEIATSMVNNWIGWDVTDWVKARRAEGAENVTFRITTPYLWRSLMRFTASESSTAPGHAPQMLIATMRNTGIEDIESAASAETVTRYYTLTGVPASTPLAPGIYIGAGAGKTIKVVVR